jgi:hypothetical protein
LSEDLRPAPSTITTLALELGEETMFVRVITAIHPPASLPAVREPVGFA